jgi:hypothetical protein
LRLLDVLLDVFADRAISVCGSRTGQAHSARSHGRRRRMTTDNAAEPTRTGSSVIARMKWDTHRATTDRIWVRMAHHESAPWVSVDDLGNVICMGWEQLIPSRIRAEAKEES